MYAVFPSALITGDAAIVPTPTVVAHFRAALVPWSRIARTFASAKPTIRSGAWSVASVASAGDEVVPYWPTANFHLTWLAGSRFGAGTIRLPVSLTARIEPLPSLFCEKTKYTVSAGGIVRLSSPMVGDACTSPSCPWLYDHIRRPSEPRYL